MGLARYFILNSYRLFLLKKITSRDLGLVFQLMDRWYCLPGHHNELLVKLMLWYPVHRSQKLRLMINCLPKIRLHHSRLIIGLLLLHFTGGAILASLDNELCLIMIVIVILILVLHKVMLKSADLIVLVFDHVIKNFLSN